MADAAKKTLDETLGADAAVYAALHHAFASYYKVRSSTFSYVDFQPHRFPRRRRVSRTTSIALPCNTSATQILRPSQLPRPTASPLILASLPSSRRRCTTSVTLYLYDFSFSLFSTSLTIFFRWRQRLWRSSMEVRRSGFGTSFKLSIEEISLAGSSSRTSSSSLFVAFPIFEASLTCNSA